MVAEEETIMIAIDNSRWMACLDPYSYGLQLDAVRSYIRAKLKLNPKNAIGIVAMGTSAHWLQPTTDLHKILAHFQYGLMMGGELDLIRGINSSQLSLEFGQPSKRKRRILLFTGGPSNFDIQLAEMFGKSLKQQGVAVDVINFCLKERHDYYKRVLDAFIAAANNNDNSRIKHIQADSCTTIRDVLSSIPAFIPPALLQAGDHLARKIKVKGPKRENQPAALEVYAEPQSKEGDHLPRKLKAKGPKPENQPAALEVYAEPQSKEGDHLPRKVKAKGPKRENQPAALYAEARSRELGKQRKPMEPRDNFKALSLDNNGKVKFAKGKNEPAALAGYAEARLMERGKHNPMELRNKFQALSLDNN